MKRLFIGLITCVTYFVGCTEVYVGLNPEDILNISVNSIDIGCEGGNTEVIVESMCAWKIDTKDCSWATIDTKIGDKGKSKLTITVLENTTFDKRTATFSIGDYNRDIQRDIIITQDANTPNLELSTTSIEASMDGITKSVTVKSNVSITVSSSEKWCTVDKTTLSRGNNQVKISVEYNHTTQSRSAIVTLSNEEYDIMREIDIVQEASTPDITVDMESLSINGHSATEFITIQSSIPWIASCDLDWLSLSRLEGEIGRTTLSINISRNETGNKRQGSVILSNDEYQVYTTIIIEQESLYVMYYTALSKVTPYNSTSFNVNILDNIWEDGKGEIFFDGPITYIGKDAFRYCDNLTSITIPNSVTSIGNSAFSGCENLTSIIIPNSVTEIGERAFFICDNLASVTIGSSVTSIGNSAFWGCDNLTSIIIPNSVTSIGELAFSGCDNLTNVTIGSSVTSIGNSAFAYCDNLTNVTIGSSVTSIGNSAFAYCDNLTSIIIPNSVTEIGERAFDDCENLTSVTISDSVTTIGSQAFMSCISLKEFKGEFASADGRCLIIDGTLNSFAPYGLTEYIIPDSVTSIGNSAFWGCDNLTSIIIPNSVTSIGESAFSGCDNLTNVTIGSSVTSIGNSAFSGCENLTSIIIPNSVTEIGESAFFICDNLASVTIGSSVTVIGGDAFWCCYNLTSIIIPNSVTSIGERAFWGCTNLKEVYCKATTPPNALYVYDEYYWWGAFDDNAPDRKIYVPRESVDAYKTANEWKNYASAIVGYDF